MTKRLERYHEAIKGTPGAKHSANQKVAGLVMEGERLQIAHEATRTRKRSELSCLPSDEVYLALKRERILGRVARVLAGYDGGIPEVFHAELRFLGFKPR